MSKELTLNGLLPVLPANKLSEKQRGILNTSFVGIDFGTSTTVVSIARFEKGDNPINVTSIELNQKLEDGTTYSSYKVPTVIAWYNNNIVVGEGAKKLKYKLRKGKNLWHSFKMELGEDVGSKYPNSELGKSHPLLTILNPIDATTLFFKYLKAQIERYVKSNGLPEHIEYAISIPASFEANQRKDLIQSIESNGIMINKQSLIDEPNAAFLSYVLTAKSNNQAIKIPEDYYPNVLVFDFGAGTCDVSILEIGQDNHGVYSKNISISKFEKLGGDDIDRLISVDILLSQLLNNSSFSIESFQTRELNELIIPKLMPFAERLKIQISEAIALLSSTKDLKELAGSDDFITLGKEITIETSKGNLFLAEPKLTYKEFAAIINIFTKENELLPATRVEKELEFVSIFNPIKTALKKAHLDQSKIDYVLFIGGSAKNPFIQSAVSKFFQKSEKLIPKDLQAHVSAGAAIHSLIYNGFGKNVIQPITSEPILLITKDAGREIIEPIIEAGTVIPSQVKVIENLTPQRDGQETIEMPICVGSKNKMLYNIKMYNPEGKGFNISEKIKLEIEINSDKMLIIRASTKHKQVMVEPLSPFANKELNTEERIKYKAERDFNLECEKNGGSPTLDSLQKLHKAYEMIGLHFKAAETLETIEEMFPGKGNLNNIGLHYSNAGKKEKAISFYERAMTTMPTATTAFNIAMQYQYSNRDKYFEYLNKAHSLSPTDNPSSYLLGKELMEQGKKEEGKKLLEAAFERWQKKFEVNQMEKWDYSWFASCAKALGKHDYAKHIEESEPRVTLEKSYVSGNLTQVKQEQGLRKY